MKALIDKWKNEMNEPYNPEDVEQDVRMAYDLTMQGCIKELQGVIDAKIKRIDKEIERADTGAEPAPYIAGVEWVKQILLGG